MLPVLPLKCWTFKNQLCPDFLSKNIKKTDKETKFKPPNTSKNNA